MAQNITLGLMVVDNEKVEVSVLDKTLNISLTSDVDFTEFVRELAMLIPSKSIILFETPTSENPKTALVINTISSIIDAYNSSLIDGDAVVEG